MSNLQIFKNQEFGEVRTVLIKDKPYFVAIDIARKLGYNNPNKAINDHCRCITKWEIPHPQSNHKKMEVNCIPEGDIYRLIVRSELPSAIRFESWIFDDVLPTIRRTGGYVNNEDVFINTYLPYADEATKSMFKSTLEVIRKQNEAISIMQPKSDYFDALVERNLLTNFRDTAKALKIGERNFIKWLEANKYIYRDAKKRIKPYSTYTPELFELKEWERNGKADVQTLITPRGRETFRLLLIKDGLIKDIA